MSTRYGKGSVIAVKDKNGKPIRNKWRVRCSQIDPITNQRKWVTQTITGSKRDAEIACSLLVNEIDNGVRLIGHSITFAEYAANWLKNRNSSGQLAVATLRDDDCQINAWSEELGSLPLSKITRWHIDKALESIKSKKRGRKTEALSPTTIRAYLRSLSAVFRHAQCEDLISKNPVEAVIRPKSIKPDRRSLTEDEFKQLTDKTMTHWKGAVEQFTAKEDRRKDKQSERNSVRGLSSLSRLLTVRIGCVTGMRLGEILALRWQDYENGVLHVKQSLGADNVPKPPKTKSSYRPVPIDAKTCKMIDEYRIIQQTALKSIGLQEQSDIAICCSDAGDYQEKSNFEHWWSKWRQSCGYNDLTFHELRHTHATLLLTRGLDLALVSKRLGHESITTTLAIYAHAIPGRDNQAVETLADLL